MRELPVVFLPLTHGQVAIIDFADFERVGRVKWTAHRQRTGRFYATRQGPGNRALHLHREILKAPANRLADHVNGYSLDCRRSNLRLATAAQNVHNRGKLGNNSSGFKGVHRHIKGRWVAQICINRKYVYLGYFDTPEEAARAYDVAAVEFHKEFACLNFPNK